MSYSDPGEDFEFYNDFLQVKLCGVVGVPEMIPVTRQMVQREDWATEAYVTAVLKIGKEAEKTLLPLYNKLRSRDQTPATQAFRNISERSSSAELKSAQAIFTATCDEFQQLSHAWKDLQGDPDAAIGWLSFSCQCRITKHVERFWRRGDYDEAILRKLSEAIKTAEKAEKDKAAKDKAAKDKAAKDKAANDKAAKDKAEKDKVEKDREAKDKLKKDKAEKDRADKEKAEKENHPTKEQVYITFETKVSSAVLLLTSHIDNTAHSTEIKSGKGGLITATGRDGNPTSTPVALFVRDGAQYIVTGGLTFKGDGSGHIVSADTGNSHLTVTRGEDAQHFCISWDGITQGSSD